MTDQRPQFFNFADGLYFECTDDDRILIVIKGAPELQATDIDGLASLMAHLSARGGDADTVREAKEFLTRTADRITAPTEDACAMSQQTPPGAGEKLRPYLEDCEYCEGAADCPAVYGGIQACTRPEGHDGPHVACGTFNHEIRTWHEDETTRGT